MSEQHKDPWMKEGGPAFPCQDVIGSCYKGMSLRDYFAADAPITIWDAQMVLNKGTSPIGSLPEHTRREVFAMTAKVRFEYADAMVAESEAK